jgi:hypothetical protein
MAKKDFEAIAAVIRDVRENVDCSSYSDVSGAIAKRISDVCAENNERFDRRRFLRACGM